MSVSSDKKAGEKEPNYLSPPDGVGLRWGAFPDQKDPGEAINRHQGLKSFAKMGRYSKKPQMQGAHGLRNEAVIEVRCNDKGCSATQQMDF
jgi:hypothetical protein